MSFPIGILIFAYLKIFTLQDVATDIELEDETSISLHSEALRNEAKKLRPDLIKMRDRMKRTATQRATEVATSSTQQVLEKFPWLSKPELVSHQ